MKIDIKNITLLLLMITSVLVINNCSKEENPIIQENNPTLDLVYPAGGESIPADTTIKIIWSSAFIDTISIYLSTNNGIDWVELSNSISAELGEWDWITPEINSDCCKIKIIAKSSPSINDESDSTFSIYYEEPILRIFNEVDINPWYYLSKWIKFSVDSKYLLSSNGRHTNIWDIVTGTIASEINEVFVDINGGQYSIVTAVNLPLNIISIWQGIPPQLKYSQLDGYMYTSKISSDGKKLLTAYYGGELNVRDLENPALSNSRWPNNEWFEDHINIIKLSQDDEIIASYGTHNLTFYKLQTGEMVFELELNAQNLAFSPQGDILAMQILGNSSKIEIRDRLSGDLIKELNTGTALYYDFNPDGSRIVYSTGDDVRIWDVEKNELAEILFEETGAKFRGVAYSPDGMYIAAKKYQSDIWIYGPLNN